jgi:putative ABC transport system ATP-binding protein
MTDPVISLSELKFKWKPNLPFTINIKELSILKGERVFIYGPSGSGKTTLLGLFGGVLSASSGSLMILGHELDKLSDGERDQFRADHIGFIFQQFNLIPYLNVIENVLLPLRFSGRKEASTPNSLETAKTLLSRLEIPATHFQKKIFELSVGQQQRVAAARAMIGPPEIVIADEPTSALDLELRDTFVQVLEDLVTSCGSTLIFVSHDHSLSRLFDRKIDLPLLNKQERSIHV